MVNPPLFIIKLLFGESFDKSFQNLLKVEFQKDLEAVIQLSSIDSYESPNAQNALMELMREKYTPEGVCPSPQFPYVSKHLQQEYGRIHEQICSVLYS